MSPITCVKFAKHSQALGPKSCTSARPATPARTPRAFTRLIRAIVDTFAEDGPTGERRQPPARHRFARRSPRYLKSIFRDFGVPVGGNVSLLPCRLRLIAQSQDVPRLLALRPRLHGNARPKNVQIGKLSQRQARFLGLLLVLCRLRPRLNVGDFLRRLLLVRGGFFSSS